LLAFDDVERAADAGPDPRAGDRELADGAGRRDLVEAAALDVDRGGGRDDEARVARGVDEAGEQRAGDAVVDAGRGGEGPQLGRAAVGRGRDPIAADRELAGLRELEARRVRAIADDRDAVVERHRRGRAGGADRADVIGDAEAIADRLDLAGRGDPPQLVR